MSAVSETTMCRRACEVLNKLCREHPDAIDVMLHEVLAEGVTFLDILNDVLEAYAEEPIAYLQNRKRKIQKFLPASEVLTNGEGNSHLTSRDS